MMDKLLERGVEEIIEKDHLIARLNKGDKLRVKLGIDPTAKELHLGHTVVLRKLRQFQEAGHKTVFIIGDFTATVGDPSGRSELRPVLTQSEIKDNMKNYLAEAGKVIDIKKTEVHYNSEWYKDKGLDFLMDLTSKFTVARMLERDDFQKRLKSDQDISLLETLYPLLQGYDSFAIKADLELGGTDQKFNLLAGRKVQKRFGQPEQDIIMVPLIEGLDGVKKMSKSLGNHIGLSENSENMFGKIMSISDSLVVKYFTLLTDVSDENIVNLKKDRENPSLAQTSPKEWKEKLAFELVKMYYGEEKARKAKGDFNKSFGLKSVASKDIPNEMLQKFFVTGSQSSVMVLVDSGLVTSKTEAKKLIEQGAITRNDKKVESWDDISSPGDILKKGPHKFLKIEERK